MRFAPEPFNIDRFTDGNSLEGIKDLNRHPQLLFKELREVGKIRSSARKIHLGRHASLLLATIITVRSGDLCRQPIQRITDHGSKLGACFIELGGMTTPKRNNPVTDFLILRLREGDIVFLRDRGGDG